jgi:alpha-2-macroglobulin
LSKVLSDPYYWMSTQETAMCLKAIGSFAGMEKRGEFKFAYTINGKTTRVVSQQAVYQVPVAVLDLRKQNVTLENQGTGSLFARIITEGIPAQGQEEDAQNNLGLSVRYTTVKGAPIDITSIEQGTQLVAEVSVTHKGTRSYYENLALAQVFPSGFEINNLRLTDDNAFLKSGSYNYQDIRDDRVYTYFGLSANETRTFKVLLTASYSGSFYLPAVSCEAMYDHSIYARQKGSLIEIVKPGVQ